MNSFPVQPELNVLATHLTLTLTLTLTLSQQCLSSTMQL